MQRILVLIVALIFHVVASAKNTALWHDEADLPYRVQEIYPTLYDGYLVVAGGLSPDISDRDIDVSKRVIAYSLSDKTWHEWPAFSIPRHHPQLVVVNERLFSFGGFALTASGAWTNSTDVLELVSDDEGRRWQWVSQMPFPLSETLITVYNNSVHLVTGRTPIDSSINGNWRDHTDTNAHMVLDVVTQRWRNAAPAPTARNSACAVQVDKKLYTIGGRTVEGGNTAVNESYDLQRQTWQPLAPLPQAQGGLACASVGDDIFVFGGEYFDNGGGVYAEVWRYSISQNAWQQSSTMPVPRHGLGTIAYQGDIYVIAGAAEAGGNKTSARMSRFSPK